MVRCGIASANAEVEDTLESPEPTFNETTTAETEEPVLPRTRDAVALVLTVLILLAIGGGVAMGWLWWHGFDTSAYEQQHGDGDDLELMANESPEPVSRV